MNQSAFFIRARANEGVKYYLRTPEGELTEFYLLLRGKDSDHFRAAEAAAKRRMAEFDTTQSKEKAIEFFQQEQNNLIAELVMGWNFEESFTLENVRLFLREAPQIADGINSFVGDRERFFRASSKSSTPSATANSSSANT